MNAGPLRVVVGGALPFSFPANAFSGRIDLQVAQSDEALCSAVRDADVLYSWTVPDIVPAQAPHLRWVHLASAGADHVRSQPIWTSDIILTSAKGIHTVPMAEHFFAMLLALTRQVPAIVRFQDRREWVHSWRSTGLELGELRGKTIGIVGWGRTGGGIAHLARAFGMRVVGTRRSSVVPAEAPRDGPAGHADPPWLEQLDLPPDIIYPAAQLHDVLAQSDVVVLILPLTRETSGSFGPGEFRAMKRGSLFFNLGRGDVVDEGALIEALEAGRLAGAGLDVFAQEPLPRSSPLWSMPNVLVSPHVGGMSRHTRERGAAFFAVNLMRYLEGQPLLNVVERSQEY
jgi:phosphoglycerate dehydrogenase-like enzyme